MPISTFFAILLLHDEDKVTLTSLFSLHTEYLQKENILLVTGYQVTFRAQIQPTISTISIYLSKHLGVAGYRVTVQRPQGCASVEAWPGGQETRQVMLQVVELYNCALSCCKSPEFSKTLQLLYVQKIYLLFSNILFRLFL